MNEFNQIINQLKDIIKQAENSGKVAWKAGELLRKIREHYKSKDDVFFQEYIKEEFKITEQTANTYIKIHESFTEDEIGTLIASNLKIIATIKNYKLRKSIVSAFVNSQEKDFKVKDVIATVALLDQNREISLEEIQDIVRKTIQKSKNDKDESKEKKKDWTKFGDPLKSEYIPLLGELMEKQPINEMGVVALFCIIFNYMRKPFQIGKHILEFKSIKYVQTGFPDACIICKLKDKKQSNIDLQVEFEYYSFDYIYHKHHKSDKKCDMIICWEDTAKKDKDWSKSEVVKQLPPILELKEFLDTGEITLKQ